MTPLHHAGHSQRLGHHITCFVCIVILSLIHNTECLPKAHSNSNEPLSSHFADYLLLSYAYTITKPKTKPKSYITIGSQAFVNIITHWWVTDCLRWCFGMWEVRAHACGAEAAAAGADGAASETHSRRAGGLANTRSNRRAGAAASTSAGARCIWAARGTADWSPACCAECG